MSDDALATFCASMLRGQGFEPRPPLSHADRTRLLAARERLLAARGASKVAQALAHAQALVLSLRSDAGARA